MRRLAVPALLLLAACDPHAEARDDLRDAVERWNDAGVDDYAFTFHYSCYCDRYGDFQIVVEDDTVASAERIIEDGEEVDPWQQIPAMTIDEMFDRIDDALDQDPEDADVRLDDDLGYPIRVRFDFEENIADEEWGFGVRSFSDNGFQPHD